MRNNDRRGKRILFIARDTRERGAKSGTRSAAASPLKWAARESESASRQPNQPVSFAETRGTRVGSIPGRAAYLIGKRILILHSLLIPFIIYRDVRRVIQSVRSCADNFPLRASRGEYNGKPGHAFPYIRFKYYL